MNNESEVIDPDYPYEEILQIVKETKKLLSVHILIYFSDSF